MCEYTIHTHVLVFLWSGAQTRCISAAWVAGTDKNLAVKSKSIIIRCSSAPKHCNTKWHALRKKEFNAIRKWANKTVIKPSMDYCLNSQ